MNGIALTVLLSQIPKLLGFSITSSGPLRVIWAIVREVTGGSTNSAAAVIGIGSLVLILLLKRWPRIPGILIVVVATAVIAGLGEKSFGVSVLGALPQGLPSPSLPLVSATDLASVVTGGFAIALIAFADTSVLSRTYAMRRNTPVDPNQEMIGLGVANLAAAFFRGFPISSSSSRTPVAEASGARTQVTGVVAAGAIALILLFAPALLQYLPNTTLAAVVISSAIGLIEVSDLRRIYRIQPWEFWLSMVCFAGVATLGAIPGIAIALAIAIIEFLWGGWRPHSAVLGYVERAQSYHDISRHSDARLIPGLVLFRWDAPLFFANAELFNERALDAIGSSPTPVRWLVVAAEPVTDVDVTAADLLAELDDKLHNEGIELSFAEMKDPVKDKLKRFELLARFGEKSFFHTISEAVSSYRAAFPVLF
jgi:MFS superfamily sulfate permease-like transporter